MRTCCTLLYAYAHRDTLAWPVDCTCALVTRRDCEVIVQSTRLDLRVHEIEANEINIKAKACGEKPATRQHRHTIDRRKPEAG